MMNADQTSRRAAASLPAIGPVEPDRIDVGDTRPDEIADAVGVVARAMSTSPMSTAVIRGDRARVLKHLTRFFTRLYDLAREQRPLVVRLDGRVVGSANDLVGHSCRFGARERLRALPDLLRTPPGITARSVRWLNAWEHLDPDAPHSHFGPFGVEPELQGRGLGSALMAEYTRRLDTAGEDAYLETDKPENVALYGRFGFDVVEEDELFGVPNWFMWRPAGADAPGTRNPRERA